MIVSMTGYGEVHRSDDGVEYSLEIRSVNNRYFKPVIKLPESVQWAESVIEKLLRGRLTRGSVTAIFRKRNATATAAYDVNQAALSCYANALAKTELPNGVQATVDLATLTALPGVCQMPEMTETQREEQLAVINELVEKCLDHVVQMREREGKALHDDLLHHCACLRKELDGIVGRAPVVIEEYRERLTARVEMLMGDGRFELAADSLAREVALYADRCDISEEIARLHAHLDHFVEICEASAGVGRKLDFLAQEMLREANTIGSKSNDSTIARAVVEMKAGIDRIKEQVQNAE